MGLTNNLGKLSNMITSTGSAVLVNGNTASNYYKLQVFQGVAEAGILIKATNSGRYAPFAVVTDTNATQFAILENGKVGIGTGDPDNSYQGLTIFGSDPSLRLKTNSSGGWTWTEYVNSAGVNNFSVGVNQAGSFFGIKAGAGMDNPNLVVSSAGRVGIATTSPASRLTILQSSDAITNGFRIYRANNSDWQEVYMTSGFGLLNDTLTFYSSFAGRNVAGIDRIGQIASITAGVDGSYNPSFISVYVGNTNESNAISTTVSSVASNSGFRFDVSNGAGSTGRTASFYINRSSVSAPFDLYVGGQAYKPGGGSWANSSDIRLKENVKTIENALDKVLQLRGVTFDWKEGYTENGKKESGGFIADEVLEVFPDWVSETNATETQKEIVNDDKIKSLSLPFSFDALLVEAIKELSAKVTALENK